MIFNFNIKSPLRFPGGKNRKNIRHKLLKYFPDSFQEYREPFCGSAGLYFSLPTHLTRWINDIDKNLIAFFNSLKNHPQKFISSCREIEPHKIGEPLTSTKPGGRQIYNARLKEKFDEFVKNEDMDTALRYFFINRTVWAGRVNYNIDSRLYFSNPPGWNIVKTNKLEQCAKILKGTKITSVNYSHLLEETGNDVLVYLDPPYIKDTEMNATDKLYANNFTMDDHVVLCENVKKCKHKVVMSYDDKPFIRDLYKDFVIDKEEWLYSGSSLATKKMGMELVIRNYQ